MTKRFYLLKFLLLFCITLIILVACNNADKTAAVEPAAASDGKSGADAKVQVAATAFGGYLNTLWADSMSFKKLYKQKVIFASKIVNTDTVLMDGWYLRKGKNGVQDTFYLTPDIQLQMGKSTSVLYGADTYFGNLVLMKDDIKHVIDTLDKYKSKYVLFFPKIVDKHIRYDIHVGDNQYEKEVVILKATDITANPSPPKQY